MKKVIDSVWTKVFVSILGLLFVYIVGVMAYRSIFYDVFIPDKTLFLLLVVGTTMIFAVTMLYTRKQFLTRVSSLILMVLILPIALFWFGNWALLIPVATLSVIIFLFSGASERTKTIFGALLILYYVLGALAYYLVSTLLTSQIYEITTEKDITSVCGVYRAYIEDAPGSVAGTEIFIEPNDKDIDNRFMMFRPKGYIYRVYVDNNPERKPATELSLEWKTETREQCIAEMLAINPDFKFTGLSDKQYRDIGIPPLSKTKNSKDETVLKPTPVYLRDLTPEQLDKLGIPLEGDVLYVDGAIRFRFISAVVENRFNSIDFEKLLK